MKIIDQRSKPSSQRLVLADVPKNSIFQFKTGGLFGRPLFRTENILGDSLTFMVDLFNGTTYSGKPSVQTMQREVELLDAELVIKGNL